MNSDKYQVTFRRAARGGVMTFIHRQAAFPCREWPAPYPREGEEWEVYIVGENQRGTTCFVAPAKTPEQLKQFRDAAREYALSAYVAKKEAARRKVFAYIEELRAAEALSLFSICDLPGNERTKLVRCVRPVDSTKCWVLSTAVGGLEGGSRDDLFFSKEEAEAAHAKWTATPPEGWGWSARVREYEIIPFAALKEDKILGKLSILPPVCVPTLDLGMGK